MEAELGVPHSEETLALLVNVSIVGGNKDLAEHLGGLTMRVDVLQELIEILRQSGYPGYEKIALTDLIESLVAYKIGTQRSMARRHLLQ